MHVLLTIVQLVLMIQKHLGCDKEFRRRLIGFSSAYKLLAHEILKDGEWDKLFLWQSGNVFFTLTTQQVWFHSLG